jgi:hypothetical protein
MRKNFGTIFTKRGDPYQKKKSKIFFHLDMTIHTPIESDRDRDSRVHQRMMIMIKNLIGDNFCEDTNGRDGHRHISKP